MNTVHKKNIAKFIQKFRHIRGQGEPSERSLRAICMGLNHLNSFLRKGICQHEYLTMARHWIRLLDETRRKMPAKTVEQFLEVFSLEFLDLLVLPTPEKGLLIHTLTVWSSLLKIDKPELIMRIVTQNLDKFQNFQQILFKMGNYYCQFLATEVLARFLLPFDTKTTKTTVERILVGDKLQQARNLLININLRRFDGDSRIFLNTFNDSFDEWSVFSVCAKYGKVENYTMVQPVDNGAASELWFDINFRDYSVTFFCDGKTFAEKQNQWVFIELERTIMQDIVLDKVNDHIEITVFLNEKGQISGEERNHQFRKVMFGVGLNGQTEILINHILPMFTGKSLGKTYSELVASDAPKRPNPIAVKRHAKTKLMKSPTTPTIVEEELQTCQEVEKKSIAQIFDPSQKPIDYSALMESMSNYTFDDVTTNFGTIGGRTEEENDNEDDEIVKPTPEQGVKEDVPEVPKASTGVVKTSSDSNKENEPPVVNQPKSVPQLLVNIANDHISSTVHLDDSNEPPELVCEIAHEYEYDTGDVDDDYNQDIEPPSQATYTVNKSKPEPKESTANDVFDFVMEDAPKKANSKTITEQPKTSRKAGASQATKKGWKKVDESMTAKPLKAATANRKTKKTRKPSEPKKDVGTQKRSVRTKSKSNNYNIASESEGDVAEPKRSTRTRNKSYNYNCDIDSEEEVPKPKKVKNAANVLLAQVLTQRNMNKPATDQPPPPESAKKPTDKVNLNLSIMENNWLMKKFIDSSMDSNTMVDPDQEIESVSNYQGVSGQDTEPERPVRTQTIMRKVSGTTIRIRKATDESHKPVKVLEPAVTATSEQTHHMSVSKRTYNDSCDLVTTEIFQQNIKRTKFSTPKVYEDPKVMNKKGSMDVRYKDDSTADKRSDVIAVATDLQNVREKLNTTVQQMSTSFWKNLSNTNATLNNQLADTTRNITNYVMENANQLQTSFKRFREMRKKEDEELQKIHQLSEANRQLAFKCKKMTDNMMQVRDERMRSSHEEFNEMTKSFLDQSSVELTNQWSAYKKSLAESMQNVFNNLLMDI